MQALFGSVIFALLLASALTWTAALRRLVARRELLPLEPRRHCPWGLLDLALTLMLVLGGQVAAAELLQERYGIEPGAALEDLAPKPRAAVLLVSALANLAVSAASVVLVILRSGARPLDLGLSAKKAGADLVLGAAAFLMLAPLVYGIQLVLVQWFESKHPLLELLREQPDPRFLLLCGFSAIAVAPLAEEYFFRLLLQGWLERLATSREHPRRVLLGGRRAPSNTARESGTRPADGAEAPSHGAMARAAQATELNPYQAPQTEGAKDNYGPDMAARNDTLPRPVPFWPILASASLFALAHWSHGPDPIPLFVLAVGLGFLYQRTHRILPCIVVHCLLNSLSLTALWLGIRYDLG